MVPRNKQRHRSNDEQDPNFNLDEYLEEKGAYSQNTQTPIEDEPESEKSFLRNAVLIMAVIVSGFLWYFDWSPRAAYNAFFGDSGTEVVSTSPIVVNIPPINVDIPDIDIDIPEIVTNSNPEDLGTIIEYLQELQALGLLNDDKLSAFSARETHKAGVPISYLVELDQNGYLNELSFVAIGEFYNKRVPFEYLEEVKQRGYWDDLSFIDISEFYRNSVPFEYLDQLKETGYLDELSFVAITEYSKNGVTPEFLDQLKETGLYDELSFIDVVEIYKNEN